MEVGVYQNNSATMQNAVAAEKPVPQEQQQLQQPQQSQAQQIPMQQLALLNETLQMHGYKPSPENMQMLMKMLDAGIPLTKENIANMNMAYKMTGNLEKAVFMLSNNIPTTPKNASLLNALTEGQAKISTQIANLLDSIANLPDTSQGDTGSLKATLTKIVDEFIAKQQATQTPGQAQAQTTNLPQGQPTTSNIPQQASAISAAPAAVGQASVIPVPVRVSPQAMPQLPPLASPAPTGAQSNIPVTNVAQNISNASVAQVPVASQGIPMAQNPSAAQAYVVFEAQSPQTTQGLPTAQPAPAAPQLQAPAMPENAQTLTKDLAQTVQTAQSGQVSQSTQANETSDPLRNFQLKLAMPLQNSNPQTLENFVSTLRQALAEAQAQILAHTSGTASDPTTARVLSDIQSLNENIDFTSQIKNQMFVQVPILVNDQSFNTSIYVNKDGKNKNKNGKSSALVALDTAFLGRFETYIQKDMQSIHLQFRLESEEVETLVRSNIHKLGNLLKDHRFALDSFTFVVGERPFTLLDSFENDTQEPISRSDTVFDRLI